MGSPATQLIAVSIVQMRIIVVACKRDMDMCFWSIIFPISPAFIKGLNIYRLLRHKHNVRSTAMLLLENYKLQDWDNLDGHNFHTKFREK